MLPNGGVMALLDTLLRLMTSSGHFITTNGRSCTAACGTQVDSEPEEPASPAQRVHVSQVALAAIWMLAALVAVGDCIIGDGGGGGGGSSYAVGGGDW